MDVAITLMDETQFRMGDGQGSGIMRVQAADGSYKKVQSTEDVEKERSKTSMKDKQKIIKKTQKLDARLADWSDDEPAAAETSKYDKTVILKQMFTLKEIEEDPAAILDIKMDIREVSRKFS